MTHKDQLKQFYQWLKLNSVSEATIKNYYSQINQFFNCYDNITQENVNDYLITKIDKKISLSTKNQIIKALKKYILFAHIYGITLPKIQNTNKPHIKDYITLEELEDEIIPMLTLIFQDWEKRELILRFMFFTGLRLREIINLKRRDIDLNKRIIIIRNGKGNKDRIVKFTKKIATLLKSLFEIEPENTNALNINRNYIRWTFYSINKNLNYKKHLTPHTMRHSYSKHLLQQGIGIERLQKLLGHSDLQTTMIYANPTEEEACEDYDKYIK